MTIRREIKSRRKRARRKVLYAEQEGCCALCGQKLPEELCGTGEGVIQKPELPTLDHIKRARDGGGWEIGNLRLVHNKCNQERD